MSNPYPQLTYPGDVTSAALPGRLLGYDEVQRPYEILDAEFHPAGMTYTDGTGKIWLGCPEHGRVSAHTTVNLQYATADTMHRVMADLRKQMRKAQS